MDTFSGGAFFSLPQMGGAQHVLTACGGNTGRGVGAVRADGRAWQSRERIQVLVQCQWAASERF